MPSNCYLAEGKKKKKTSIYNGFRVFEQCTTIGISYTVPEYSFPGNKKMFPMRKKDLIYGKNFGY